VTATRLRLEVLWQFARRSIATMCGEETSALVQSYPGKDGLWAVLFYIFSSATTAVEQIVREH